MGKPFERELEQITKTIAWASEVNITGLEKIFAGYNEPIYIVGSGGSLSACHFAAALFVSKGLYAKAMTPLELFYSKDTIRHANIIFISSSGRNTDILFGFKTAVKCEPISTLSICMRSKTKLGAISAKYSNTFMFEFDNPAGKDGFLATNSLVAYFAILYRSVTGESLTAPYEYDENQIFSFLSAVDTDTTYCVLYNNYSQSVAVDIESKFTEAGLANLQVADYRNFAHGRHHWFDKRRNSAIIALTTPWDLMLCKKTLSLLPPEIPTLLLSTNLKTYESAIHLLAQSFYVIKSVGLKLNIDPGKPGVPDYGSKIYHLNYEKLLTSGTNLFPSLDESCQTAILRKAKINSLKDLDTETLSQWEKAYSLYLGKLYKAKFGALILDYDGTLCSSANRFAGLSEQTSKLLLQYLENGFVVGIVSGRGKSLREAINKIFNKKTAHLRRNVIIGYYNGSDIGDVTNENIPDKTKPLHPSLALIKQHLAKLGLIPDVSPYQLTFGANTNREWQAVKAKLLNEIMLLDLPGIQMVESSHSIDILSSKEGNKNNIIEFCMAKCRELNIETNYLCIGDKGQWPGNDYALLRHEFSLSVNEVSADPETCWNLCPPGIRNVEGTEHIFSKLKFENNFFTIEKL